MGFIHSFDIWRGLESTRRLAFKRGVEFRHWLAYRRGLAFDHGLAFSPRRPPLAPSIQTGPHLLGGPKSEWLALGAYGKNRLAYAPVAPHSRLPCHPPTSPLLSQNGSRYVLASGRCVFPAIFLIVALVCAWCWFWAVCTAAVSPSYR